MWDVSRVIMINGVPRSGTSWLGGMFEHHPSTIYRYQPLFSWEFKDEIDHTSSKDDMWKAFTRIANARSRFVLKGLNNDRMEKVENKNASTLVMKHVRYHNLVPHILKTCYVRPSSKVVFLVRDPRGCLNSWGTAPKEVVAPLYKGDEWYYATWKNQWKPSEYYGFHKWKEFCRLAIDIRAEYPSKCLIVKYEDLATNPRGTIKSVLEWCDLGYTDTVEEFLKRTTMNESTGAYSLCMPNDDVKWQLDNIDKLVPSSINEKILAELEDTPIQQFLWKR
jgi:hypothetical protein